ncbi:hypothetical protein [Endozoicomonas sp.]|uniref:hypothetical protein n=1 Tax=Endozoicomonas sp. TaxID=1892382 RepID=UPI0028850061|nr:hypothetical protein [Endozoicomonas sp.]
MPNCFSSITNSFYCPRSDSGRQETIKRKGGTITQKYEQTYREFSCSSLFCGMTVFGVNTVEKMTVTPLVGLSESSKWYYCAACCCLTSYLTHVFCDKTAVGCREAVDGSEEIYCSFKKNSCGDTAKKVGEDFDFFISCFSCSTDQRTTIFSTEQQAANIVITQQPQIHRS